MEQVANNKNSGFNSLINLGEIKHWFEAKRIAKDLAKAIKGYEKLASKMKEEGYDEEAVLGAIYLNLRKQGIDDEVLDQLADSLGYEIPEELKKMSIRDLIKSAVSEGFGVELPEKKESPKKETAHHKSFDEIDPHFGIVQDKNVDPGFDIKMNRKDIDPRYDRGPEVIPDNRTKKEPEENDGERFLLDDGSYLVHIGSGRYQVQGSENDSNTVYRIYYVDTVNKVIKAVVIHRKGEKEGVIPMYSRPIGEENQKSAIWHPIHITKIPNNGYSLLVLDTYREEDFELPGEEKERSR